jgi:hypothetical protein
MKLTGAARAQLAFRLETGLDIIINKYNYIIIIIIIETWLSAGVAELRSDVSHIHRS